MNAMTTRGPPGPRGGRCRRPGRWAIPGKASSTAATHATSAGTRAAYGSRAGIATILTVGGDGPTQAGRRHRHEQRTMADRHFVKYTFLKVDPAWRRLPTSERARPTSASSSRPARTSPTDHLLQAFTLVGIRGDADLMLVAEAENLDRIHEFHVVLAAERADEVVRRSRTRSSACARARSTPTSSARCRAAVPRQVPVRLPVREAREWYGLPADERWRVMQEHIRVGKEYPNVDNHTTYCFGLDDQEFVVAFDTDDAGAFLDLVQRLRTTEASALHRARHAELHLHRDVARARARRARRRAASPPTPRCGLAVGRSVAEPADPRGARPPARGRPGDAPALVEDGRPDFERDAPRDQADDHYAALVRSIVGQQLSIDRRARRSGAALLERFDGRAADARSRSSTTTPRSCAPPSASRAPRSASCARWPSTCSSGELELDHARDAVRRGADRRADRRQGHRRVVGAHVPDVPARAAGRPRDRRPRHPPRVERAYGLEELPSAAELRRSPSPGGRTAAPACRVPVVVARQRARLSRRTRRRAQ